MKKPNTQKIVVLCALALLIGIAVTGVFSYKLNVFAGKDDTFTALQKTDAIPESADELEDVTRQMLGSSAPSPDDVTRLNEIAPAAGK